jgi:hypothetical protein
MARQTVTSSPYSRGENDMRFMMMVKADKDSEAGLPPSPELMEVIGKHSLEMQKLGIVVGTGGLLPSSAGTRIRVAGGELYVTDGPFAEAKELIGGYAIIEAKSRSEAVEHGKRFMKLHADVLGASYTGELEIRQMYEGNGCGGPDAA